MTSAEQSQHLAAMRAWAYANLVPSYTHEDIARMSDEDIVLMVDASGYDIDSYLAVAAEHHASRGDR